MFQKSKYYIQNGGDDNFGHEKGNKDKQVRGNYASLSISCVMLTLPLLFLLLAFISWTSNRGIDKIDEKCKTREFYNGLLTLPKRYLYQTEEDEAQNFDTVSRLKKKIKTARLYSFLFLIRRLIIVLIAVILPDSLFELRVSLALALQSSYILYAILIRSFVEVKDQLVEVFNEVVLLVLIIIMTLYNSESQWNDRVVYAVIGIILFQSIILMFVSMIGALVRFIRRCKKTVQEKDNERVDSRPSIDDQLNQGVLDIPISSENVVSSKLGVEKKIDNKIQNLQN